MADPIYFIDSCQRYSSAEQIGYQYSYSSASISNAIFRARQTKSIKLANGGYIHRDLPTDAVTAIIGAAVYLSGYPATDQLIMQFRDGSNEVAGLYITSLGLPKIKTDTVTYLTGSTPIDIQSWVYLTFECLIDNSAGIVKAWIYSGDDTYEHTATSQDTDRTANHIIDGVRWGGPGAGDTYFTSIYACTWEDAAIDATPMGNIEIQMYEPILDISNTGCLSNQGTELYSTVNENTPLLADYIFLSSEGNKYLLQHKEFSFPNPDTEQSILVIQQTNLIANGNSDSPPSNIDFKFYWGYGTDSGDSDSQTAIADNNWNYYTQSYAKNPSTAIIWDEAALNQFNCGITLPGDEICFDINGIAYDWGAYIEHTFDDPPGEFNPVSPEQICTAHICFSASNIVSSEGYDDSELVINDGCVESENLTITINLGGQIFTKSNLVHTTGQGPVVFVLNQVPVYVNFFLNEENAPFGGGSAPPFVDFEEYCAAEAFVTGEIIPDENSPPGSYIFDPDKLYTWPNFSYRYYRDYYIINESKFMECPVE